MKATGDSEFPYQEKAGAQNQGQKRWLHEERRHGESVDDEEEDGADSDRWVKAPGK
jgi:hypothetical protein